MSYVDDRYCVLSLGCSCQSAFQINSGLTEIGRILGGGNGRITSAYFDWLITPSSSLARLAARGLPVPRTPEDITIARGAPEYRSLGCLFYHEFRGHDVPYRLDDDGFAAMAGKFTHLSRKTRAMIEVREPIFVWSNVQSNLTWVAPQCDDLDVMLTDATIRAVRTAIDGACGRPARYLFVTSQGRSEASSEHERVRITTLPADRSDWHGSTEDWRTVWEEALPALLQTG